MGLSGRNRVIAAVALIVVLPIAVLAVLIRGANPKSEGAAASIIELPKAPGLSARCSRKASSERSLVRQYAAARPGQTICLATGDYGTFKAGRKTGMVGVRSDRGAKASMKLVLNSVTNLRLDRVTITEAEIGGQSRNITVANSRFTGLALVRAEQLNDSNIVFDHNVHADIDTCTDCYQGRLHVDGNNGHPSGVVIKNSVFSGGNSDGVRPDADGVKVINNEFYGFKDEDPFHTDPIQLYGGTRALIRGNYFHDNAVSAQIMMADGGSGNIVEDNVIAGSGYTWALTWYSDEGSIIRHNTFVTGRCSFNVRCGMINLGAKEGEPTGRGTVIRDNIFGGISNGGDGGHSEYTADHNLTAVRTSGARNFTGAPRFRGPRASYAGYRLARGSAGRGRASDGKDLGIR